MTDISPNIDEEDVRAFMISQFRAKYVQTPPNTAETSSSSPEKASNSQTVLGYTLGENEYLLGDEIADTANLPHTANAINDKPALEAKLEEIRYRLPKGLSHIPWIETLALTSSKSYFIEGKTTDSGQDIQREQHFYALALKEIQEGLRRLKTMGIPFVRPLDYLAEMVKPDKQMESIRAKVADEQQRLSKVEKRRETQRLQQWQRTAGIAKKNSKIATEQQQSYKRNQVIKGIEDWKKQRQTVKQGHPLSSPMLSAEVSLDQHLETLERPPQKNFPQKNFPPKKKDTTVDRSSSASPLSRRSSLQKGRKRQFKDSRFGFGGPKRFKKQNTAESSSGFASTSFKGKKRGDHRQVISSTGRKSSFSSFKGKKRDGQRPPPASSAFREKALTGRGPPPPSSRKSSFSSFKGKKRGDHRQATLSSTGRKSSSFKGKKRGDHRQATLSSTGRKSSSFKGKKKGDHRRG
ncbi:hypothetical protein IE077_000278 [Cardiosporidium cionae]|uniref:rRNA-processing protein EBP2 n=1 Tax=Cardiosporidium cionae TaxID=476202 RepID=A0ABQ7JBR8_9APIC|nr:hypothetical protein IE077_000278 [Cardiosporidium cionae]|eukprot:KAF8821450.1 hypothetical protein IE077_000278 [Cardiosporidium cionae]